MHHYIVIRYAMGSVIELNSSIDVASRAINRVLLRYLTLSRGSLIEKKNGVSGRDLEAYLKKTCEDQVCIAVLSSPSLHGEVYVASGAITAAYLEIDGEQLSGNEALSRIRSLKGLDIEVYSFNPGVIAYIYQQIDLLTRDVREEPRTIKKATIVTNTLLRLTDVPCYIEDATLSPDEEVVDYSITCFNEDYSHHLLLVALRILDVYSIFPSRINYLTRVKRVEQGILRETLVRGSIEIPDETLRRIYAEIPVIATLLGMQALKLSVDTSKRKISLHIETTPPLTPRDPNESARVFYAYLKKYTRRLEVAVSYTVKTAAGSPLRVTGKAP